MIRKALKNFIYDIEPVSDRLRWVSMGYTMPVTFVNTYFHTAAHSTQEKNELVNEITKVFRKSQRKGPTYLCGDFNARVQVKLGEREQCIGSHTFHKERVTLELQDEGLKENRRLFISMCTNLQSKVMNTMFEKPDIKLVTHKHQRTTFGPHGYR